MVFSANRRTCAGDPENDTRVIWEDPEGLLPDVEVESGQTNIAIRLYTLGMLNPDTTSGGVVEGFRMDVTILVGSPASIRAAVEELEAAIANQPANCAVTPSCEG